MNDTVYTLVDTDRIVAADTSLDTPYTLRVRDLPPEKKPREKLLAYGPQALGTNELLAIVLNVGTKREDVLAMTNRILKEYGEKAIAFQTNPKKVMRELSLPEAKACQIVACFELGRRFFNGGTGRSITIRTARQAYTYLRDMRELPKEHLRGLYLNNHYRLIHDEVISIGSVSASIIHPREVFRPALEFAASTVIIAHNHPSGNLKPSPDDITITEQLVAAGKVVGVHLLDHLIVGPQGFMSIPVAYA